MIPVTMILKLVF